MGTNTVLVSIHNYIELNFYLNYINTLLRIIRGRGPFEWQVARSCLLISVTELDLLALFMVLMLFEDFNTDIRPMICISVQLIELKGTEAGVCGLTSHSVTWQQQLELADSEGKHPESKRVRSSFAV